MTAIVMLWLVSVSASACADASIEVEDAGPVLDAVPGVLASYLSDLAARDSAALRAAFVDDRAAPWIENGEVRYRGISALLQGLSELPPEAAIKTRMDEPELMRIGARGVHAWATFTTTVGEGQSSYSFGGLISFLLEHDGRDWRLVGGHVSAPVSR